MSMPESTIATMVLAVPVVTSQAASVLVTFSEYCWPALGSLISFSSSTRWVGSA
ncbi:hypothetical protein D3C87_2150650 [compost metagenome]